MSEAAIRPSEVIANARDQLAIRYWAGAPIAELLAESTQTVDDVLKTLWMQHFGDRNQIALVAVGGYGRGELQPYSDIDLLVVTEAGDSVNRSIELFLQDVFDLHMEVGHSVRSVAQCLAEAQADVTIATALFERRWLAGDHALSEQLDEVLTPERLWPGDRFFEAKIDEQRTRHKQYDNIEYNLEPNLKTSPGGLRDIQTALWICKREFGTAFLPDLVDAGVLSTQEAEWLKSGSSFLNWLRFGLHLLAGRKEDQLRFSQQRALAHQFGYEDTDAQPAVEQFMHRYYRHVLSLTEVNDIVVQFLREQYRNSQANQIEVINAHFQLCGNYIEARQDTTFLDHPAALLELFVVMANRKDVVGVRASTIRLIREATPLIDHDFRHNPAHTRLFIELLKAPYTVVSQLTLMRRYGVLGRYIPEFGRIIGQMQHDLFHIYTVDAHTMAVIRNMRRFRYRSAQKNYPVAYHCAHSIPKPELLYLAGLFHDIGKARGGDHSLLGAADAKAFCERHGISAAETELVCWLVEKHLYMSSVSQHQDIYDPEIISAFADEVKSEMRLNYLYALTVADINATNPTLWNSWRASLMRHLFNETRRALRNIDTPLPDRDAALSAFQERALERLLAVRGKPSQSETEADAYITSVKQLWLELGEDYLLRHSPKQIAGLTASILEHDLAQGAFAVMNDVLGQAPGEGATQLYIYMEDRENIFASTAVTLSNLQLSIVDASVHTRNDRCFATYTLLDAAGSPLPRDHKLRQSIIDRVKDMLDESQALPQLIQRRLPRQLKELRWPTEVSVTLEADDTATLKVLASDRPGLLAHVSQLLMDQNLSLLSARITTLGERVEDIFSVKLKQPSNAADAHNAELLKMEILAANVQNKLDAEINLPA